MDGFELQDELSALAQDPSQYEIPNEHDFDSEDPTRLLEAAVEVVAESSDSITNPEVFDVFRSVLKHSSALPGSVMNKVLDSISSGLQGELEGTIRDVESGDQAAYMAHKLPLELYAFLLQWFVTAAEKVKAQDEDGPTAPVPAPAATGKGRRGRGGRSGKTGSRAVGGATSGSSAAKAKATAVASRGDEVWTWEEQIPPTLALISRILVKLQTQRIWTTSAEREAFVSCLVKPAYHVLENEQYMKIGAIKLGAIKVVCVSVKHHNQILAAHTHIVQNLQFYEHLPEILAELLHVLATQYDHTQLGDEILREIAGKTFNAQDNRGPRNFAKFLAKFAEYSPRAVLKQLSLLLNQLDSEAYPMRIAIVEVIGSLIQELAAGLDASTSAETDIKQTQRKINGLFDLLHERTLDVSSYVRTKVINVLSKLFELKTPKFPKQRLASTRAATGALEDKAASVRKAAGGLLIKLINTHPYGMMHGGILTKELWEAEYDGVKKELERVEGKMGKAVEIQENEQEGGEENGDSEEDGESGGNGSPKPGKEKKRSKKPGKDENAMEVDEDDADEDNGSTEESGIDTDDSMSVDGQEDSNQKTQKQKAEKRKPRKSQLDMNALTQEQAALATLEHNELLHLRLKKKYYAEALTFIRQIENSMETLIKLLGSKNKAEVLEAMEFFRVAYEYGLEGAKEGIKKMLHLIWVKDNSTTTSSEDGKELKGIRQRLLEVYRSLYFDADPNIEDAKAQVNRISKNMIERTYDCTLAELTSLEEMMRVMMEEGQVHPDVINRLWMIYSSTQHLPKPQRRGAIIILGMLASAKKSVLEGHVDTMLKVGLGALGKVDLELARYTCVALQRLNGSAKKIKGSLQDNTIRYPMDSPIFAKLERVVERPCRLRDWFGLAEQAVNTVYAVGEHPDEWCTRLIKKLSMRAFSPKEKEMIGRTGTEGEEDKQGERDGDSDEKQDEKDEDGDVLMSQVDTATTQSLIQGQSQDPSGHEKKDVGDAFELSQLLFVVGHVAIKEIVFLELVEREWKRQKDEKVAAEKQASGSKKSAKDKEGEELEQVAGNAEDEIGDRIAAVRESELLYGPNSLLAVFGPMLVHICGSPHKFKNPTLRRTATLSFSKFLCVSSKYCDAHHRLLFKILETSKDSTIRSNVVIALGDIAVSFSSIIDENSNELYKGLSDSVVQVKKNTLMVLTHLILNGMVKVKGQLGEMAKCLEDTTDPEGRIAELAKLFFKELSGKENAIYNNLPDVISHLSTGEHAVDEETFQNTLRYIFTFIDKEKQAESIVEKLCQRFRLSEDPRQWRDISFCLSLLPFKSEKSVKKLIEGLQFYRDKLHEKAVYERFVEILNKARSNKSKDKPDTELDEFAKILEEHKNQGEEDQALENLVEKRKAAAKKRTTRKATRRKASTQQDMTDENED